MDQMDNTVALQTQLAAKDSLVAAMRHNIKEKQKFINYLLVKLRASSEKKKGGKKDGES